MKTIYRAFDGTDFESRNKCKKYEEEKAKESLFPLNFNVGELVTALKAEEKLHEDDEDEDDEDGDEECSWDARFHGSPSQYVMRVVEWYNEKLQGK